MITKTNPTPRQFAKTQGVCEETVRRWIRAGKLKVIRTPGGRYRIPSTEIVRLAKPELVDAQ